ncbi:hypothetical protein CDD82_4608 [Ophiocordyceps australis]|uniref:BIR-domain-containing protein n=1 Tax=Ophiocordyceps australis TaxID=1399860 RepID=A0A2C5Z7B7_9HYPO|nr:hypothetical protein CDD82_4608 [Ophiocordyceps australis]
MVAANPDQYMTYEARLASFQKPKKRGSTANTRTKAAAGWPHKFISPQSLASAGFYFDPSPSAPDKVSCFLCRNDLDGWESGDDALLEHLTHASNCGWAIVAAIQAQVGDYGSEDPDMPYMVEARKATFDGRWPHEGKKGWKCKTKQLVEAGWKFTPTLESDDMATCVYCDLALDGWERGDKPYDEHHRRSPNCTFFLLKAQFGGGQKKTAPSRPIRGSKASRLSTQSVGTLADTTANIDDSVVTTASTMAPRSKTNKATTAKGSRRKPNKTDLDEQQQEKASQPPARGIRGKKRANDALDDSTMLSEKPAPKKRAVRTRASTATDPSTALAHDSDVSDAYTQPRSMSATRPNVHADRQPSAVSTISTASIASLRGLPDSFPDDEEIERQLEQDLDKEWTEDDEAIPQHHDHDQDQELEVHHQVEKSAFYRMLDPEAIQVDDVAVNEELEALKMEMEVDAQKPSTLYKKQTPAARKLSSQSRATKVKVISPCSEAATSQDGDDDAPEYPLQEALDQAEEESLQSTGTVVKVAAEPVQMDSADPDELGHARLSQASSRASGQEQTQALAATQKGRLSKTSLTSCRQSQEKEPRRGPGRPSKASLSRQHSLAQNGAPAAEVPLKRGRGRPPKTSTASQQSVADEHVAKEQAVKRSRGRPRKTSEDDAQGLEQAGAAREPCKSQDIKDAGDGLSKRGRGRRPKSRETDASHTQEVASVPDGLDAVVVVHEDETSTKERTPPQGLAARDGDAAKQKSAAFLSTPSKPSAAASAPDSPQQSSDAENHPPSSKPAASSTRSTTQTVPVASTPPPPSKRTMLAGLHSSTPWTAINLDSIFGTPRLTVSKEEAVRTLLRQGDELASPEKGMTVEEWMLNNARQAEEGLRHECEVMVNGFERQGARAMHVLEGISTE